MTQDINQLSSSTNTSTEVLKALAQITNYEIGSDEFMAVWGKGYLTGNNGEITLDAEELLKAVKQHLRVKYPQSLDETFFWGNERITLNN
jgi:hypothetical protein